MEADDPVLLGGMPAPRLRVSPCETVFAWKLKAIAAPGIANRRMKDYFGLLALLREGAMDLQEVATGPDVGRRDGRTVCCRTRRPAMTTIADRLDLRLSVEDKNRLRRAAKLHGLPVATFVREVALREAESTIAHPPKAHHGSLAARLRGRATARLSTDEIMRLTRGT